MEHAVTHQIVPASTLDSTMPEGAFGYLVFVDDVVNVRQPWHWRGRSPMTLEQATALAQEEVASLTAALTAPPPEPEPEPEPAPE